MPQFLHAHETFAWSANLRSWRLSMVLSACTPPATPVSQPAAGQPGAGTTLTIGSKDFTEAILAAELYAQVLENAGYKVDRKFNLGATPIAQAALLKGDIDLYPEYTSTGLQEVLKDTNRYPSAGAILDAVRKGYEEQFKLTWLQASPFNDTNAFATTTAIAQQYGLKTYSDLAAKAAELRLGGPAEFPDRVDTAGLDQPTVVSSANSRRIRGQPRRGTRRRRLAVCRQTTGQRNRRRQHSRACR